ncbi:hypothetical protein PPGU19_050300 [Paraburkholderia sp. PGU19]|nr:hypothetical protein PPGU19_050300 [Paraburkholderia sp. PGU19]
MVAPFSLILMVMVPVASLTVAMVVVPVTPRATAIVARIMPFPFTSMTLLPFSAFPVTMPVIVSFAVPAGTHNYSGRWLDVHRRRRSVDWLGRIHDTGAADVDTNINMSEGDR